MKSVIYIDRNNLYYYGGNVHAPLTFPYQEMTVKDMEVINILELEKQLDLFIKTNKIEPDVAGIVISHQCSFEKIIVQKPETNLLESEKKKFLDNVPFEEIMSQSYSTLKGIKLIAVNKELIYAVKDAFQHHNFQIEIIASIAALYPETDVPFNINVAQQILKKSSQLRQVMFPVDDIEVPITDVFDENRTLEKKNTRLYLMIGFFVICIGILFALLFLPKKKEKTKKSTILPSPVAKVTQTPATPIITQTTTIPVSPLPSTSPVAKTLNVRILNGSGTVGQAEEIKITLEKLGYSNISTGNSPTIQSSKSLIVFKPTVSEQSRQEIITAVSPLAGDLSIQENADITADIVLTTAQTASSPNSPTP